MERSLRLQWGAQVHASKGFRGFPKYFFLLFLSKFSFFNNDLL
jgi:hypothetical protein